MRGVGRGAAAGAPLDLDHYGFCDPCFWWFEEWDEENFDDLFDEQEPDE